MYIYIHTYIHTYMHKYIDKQLISCNSFSSDSCWGIFVLPFLCFWGASRQPTHVFVGQTVAKRLETFHRL